MGLAIRTHRQNKCMRDSLKYGSAQYADWFKKVLKDFSEKETAAAQNPHSDVIRPDCLVFDLVNAVKKKKKEKKKKRNRN